MSLRRKLPPWWVQSDLSLRLGWQEEWTDAAGNWTFGNVLKGYVRDWERRLHSQTRFDWVSLPADIGSESQRSKAVRICKSHGDVRSTWKI